MLVVHVPDGIRDLDGLLMIEFQDVVDSFLGDQALVLQTIGVPLIYDHAGHAEKGVFQYVLVIFRSLLDLLREPAHFFRLLYAEVTSSA